MFPQLRRLVVLVSLLLGALLLELCVEGVTRMRALQMVAVPVND
jgi:hypothetical protein